MEERRKPILGRVVPGVPPDVQRRLRRFFALTQAVSARLAGLLAFRMFLTPPRRAVDPVDAAIIAQAKKSTLKFGREEFTLWKWDHGGPVVVLLHGWGSRASRFGHFIAPLQAAGFTVLGIDAPAHGDSPGATADLPRFRESLAQVLRVHEPIYAVVGHSLGGGALLTVLAETTEYHPKKICLFGVPGDMDYILESFAMMLGLQVSALANLRARFTAKFGRPARDISVGAAAPSVRIPVLVVHDEDDNVAPYAHGSALAAAIPGAQLLTTRGFGHSGALRDPAIIERVVTFLRD